MYGTNIELLFAKYPYYIFLIRDLKEDGSFILKGTPYSEIWAPTYLAFQQLLFLLISTELRVSRIGIQYPLHLKTLLLQYWLAHKYPLRELFIKYCIKLILSFIDVMGCAGQNIRFRMLKTSS